MIKIVAMIKICIKNHTKLIINNVIGKWFFYLKWKLNKRYFIIKNIKMYFRFIKCDS